MHRWILAVLFLLLVVIVASPVKAQSIETDGNVETDAQLVSNVATGTPPLAVSSTTLVPNLNVDQLDGFTALDFAFSAELLATVDALDNPDPPCFNNTHRFVDCGNGTVTDTETGLIWLLNANCFATMTYSAANDSASALAEGQCGLLDGSRPGDWRLPTKEDWEVIVAPACPIDPEIVGNGSPIPGCYSDSPWAANVQQSAFYWSSTTLANETVSAWGVFMVNGNVFGGLKTSNDVRVWPVRGGQ